MKKDYLPPKLSSPGSAMKDDSLISSMAARLRIVEEDLRRKEYQLKEKDKLLHEMRQKLAKEQYKPIAAQNIDHMTDYSQSEDSKDKTIFYLREECLRAQKQVQEMEYFLADYGMIWVGEEADDLILDEKEREESWCPAQSIPGDVRPNYNLIVSNIQELNILGGDGVGVVTKGPDGIARVRAPDPVPITLYENGLMLFDGPFRPYSEPYTQQIIQELQEGYFPSELQTKYPKGIPLKVKDLREIKYMDPRIKCHFPGQGHTMTEAAQEIAKLRGIDISDVSDNDSATQTAETSSTSMQRFLNKLPSNVIRDGKILDIRSSIGAMIGVTGQQGAIIEVAETHIVKQIQSGEVTKESPVTTLRVKMSGGTKTLIVKLNYSDTIQDLRMIIDERRRDERCGYEIRTTFPSQSYDVLDATLEEAQLVPNAILHIRNLE